MLDVDALATFMMSVVTNYFAKCGDSLETILDDTIDSHSALNASSSSKETSNVNQRHGDPLPLVADGMTTCHSIELNNDKQPFETEKMNGTDLIFFPRPSSETMNLKKALIGKTKSSPLPEREQRTPNDLDNSTLILNKICPTKNIVLSPPSEVASRWIAMGFKENRNIKTNLPLQQQHNDKQQHQFPFDEIKIENSKRRPPLATRPQSKIIVPLTSTGARVNNSAGALNTNAQVVGKHDNIHLFREVRTPKSRPIAIIETTHSGDDNTLLPRDNIGTTDFDVSHKNRGHQIGNRKMSSQWRSAVDPRSGQTYYFHEITRETQWRKPTELATDEEKSAMEEKEQKEKDFFAAMEANILNSLSRGVIPGASAQDTAIKEEKSEGSPELERNPSGIKQQSSFRRLGSRARSRAGRPELVRTISTMDESVLQDVIRRQPSFRSVKSGLSKKEPSLQIDDLREFLGSRSGPTRQNDSMCSSSQGSDSILETLEEDVGESTFNIAVDAMPDSDDLNWNETRALTKLFSITKEMINADEEHLNKNDRRSVKTIAGTTIREGNTPTPTRTLRRVTDGDLGRTLARALPRELELEDPGEKKERPSLNVPRGKRAARMLANSEKTAADLLRPPVPTVQRRNTCGTMYIRTTMSAPDKDATIRCVCGVYRSHIISSEHMNLSKEETESLSVFNDYPDNAPGMQNENPSLHEITTFYRDIFFKAQMEADCIIMSLIYVERLIKKTGGRLRPKATNWRSLLFSCMILSSKVWDDLSMWNADFSQSCPPGGVNFSLQRINQLELAILNTLKFNVKVPASEYAKYYFLLRSMLIKSGLGGEDLSSLDPLDVDGARRLQQVSSQFESISIKAGNSLDFGRSKSLAVESNQNAESFRHPKTKVGLEQVVKM